MYFIAKQEIKQLFGPNKSSTSGGPAQTVEGVAGELPYCRSLCEHCAKMFLPLVICLFAALEIHEATGQPAGTVQHNCGGKRMKSVVSCSQTLAGMEAISNCAPRSLHCLQLVECGRGFVLILDMSDCY